MNSSRLDTYDSKPPIGIMPKEIWDNQRTIELREAIIRYLRADMPVPAEWLSEYNELISRFN